MDNLAYEVGLLFILSSTFVSCFGAEHAVATSVITNSVSAVVLVTFNLFHWLLGLDVCRNVRLLTASYFGRVAEGCSGRLEWRSEIFQPESVLFQMSVI